MWFKKSVLLLALAAPAFLPAASLDQTNVEYSHPGKPLLLDLHIPEGTGPFAAAILIHGGGFDGGSKSTNVKPLFQPLADAGIAWFTIDYRLAPAAQFSQVNDDVNSAIQWVKAHAASFHINPAKIALIGESAGGFLVNYTGTHETSESKVAAVVDFYGPSDYGKLAQLRSTHPELFDMTTINRHAANGGGIHFFGLSELNDAGLEKLNSLAPIKAVHKTEPPFLCLHGTKDDQVAYQQSSDFCAAIKAAGATCQLITIEGGAHGMSRWREPEMQHWKPEMISWLKQTLNLN